MVNFQSQMIRYTGDHDNFTLKGGEVIARYLIKNLKICEGYAACNRKTTIKIDVSDDEELIYDCKHVTLVEYWIQVFMNNGAKKGTANVRRITKNDLNYTETKIN